MNRDVEIKTMTEDKKLLSISLEPDMWFEIADALQRVLGNMEYVIKHPEAFDTPTKVKSERNYWYLKSIVALLETQLTE